MSRLGLPLSARRRKVDAARAHLLAASWACVDAAEALHTRGNAGGLTAAERAELATLVDAANLAGRSRRRLDELVGGEVETTPELPGQTSIDV